MSVHSRIHNIESASIQTFDAHDPPFATVDIRDAKGNNIVLFFPSLDEIVKFANGLINEAHTLVVDE